MSGGDGYLRLPNSDSRTGSAVIVLGEDIAVKGFGSAKFEIDGYLDGLDAGDNDYIDFLNGGLLEMQTNRITEDKIKDHIASGYFTTSYSQPALNGTAPIFGPGPGIDEHYGVVYEDKGDGRWHIHVGIAVTPPVCTPPDGDLDDDCIVDLADLRIMAGVWLNDTSITL